MGRCRLDRRAVPAGAAGRDILGAGADLRHGPPAPTQAAPHRREPEDVPDPLRKQHAQRALLGHARALSDLRPAQPHQRRLGRRQERQHRLHRTRCGGVRQALSWHGASPLSPHRHLRLLPGQHHGALGAGPACCSDDADRRQPQLRPNPRRELAVGNRDAGGGRGAAPAGAAGALPEPLRQAPLLPPAHDDGLRLHPHRLLSLPLHQPAHARSGRRLRPGRCLRRR
mmetsp:Transcript_3342/g.7889  ORF Transcript_3342/g.7889 Transcript_3342/m.7889 type:complete len:227 (+) Transcript_3342:716-1396(+)